ncbi:MAG: histidine phosphatase family protein [Rubellimicrobium sp.]|nr:histidine phosphatase family protein [Rubellimicrobium sp.]
MTLRLILTRHAKSDWASAALGDHDRPLNARGRRQAPLIGQWLVARGYLPDRVLCSDATRTRETADLIRTEMPDPPRVTHLAALYHASADGMLDCLKRAEGRVVMMIGHNPGIADFAALLAQTQPSHPRFGDYPTLTTVIFDFDAESWSSVAPGTGVVVDVVIPADLAE